MVRVMGVFYETSLAEGDVPVSRFYRVVKLIFGLGCVKHLKHGNALRGSADCFGSSI